MLNILWFQPTQSEGFLSLGFGLLVGQNNTFEDITLGSDGHFSLFSDFTMIELLIKIITGRLIANENTC